MSNLAEKRARVRPNKKAGVPWAIMVAAAILLAGAGAVWAARSNSVKTLSASAKPVVLEMADIGAKVENGKIVVPFDEVKQSGLVRFTYKAEKSEIPLLAYITPAGKVLTAISMCEPCSSTRFFIQGDRIVCKTCYTKWDVETLKGVAGGCTKYPPERLDNAVKDGNILIDESTVAKWQPRV